MSWQWWRDRFVRGRAVLAATVLAAVVVAVLTVTVSGWIHAGRHRDTHDSRPSYGGWGTCDLRLPRPDVLPDPRSNPCAVDPGGPLRPATSPPSAGAPAS